MQSESDLQLAEKPLPDSPPASSSVKKWLTVLLVVALLATVCWFVFATPQGAMVRAHPRQSWREFHRQIDLFVRRHKIAGPVVYLAVYVTFAVLALPVWWLQLLAGIAFGLVRGTMICVIGSTLAVTIAVGFIRWVASDWFHQRIENRLEQLKKLDENLEHNGFLFVMTARLIPLVPFGLFNYAIALSKISYRDIILGTFLGAIPLVAVHVAFGAGYDPHDWVFDVAITSLTLILLTPVVLRYLRPQWFKKIGVE